MLRVLKALALASSGILAAYLGFGFVAWFAGLFPVGGAWFQTVGVALIAMVVGLVFMYPILSMYGIVRPASESLRWLKHRR